MTVMSIILGTTIGTTATIMSRQIMLPKKQKITTSNLEQPHRISNIMICETIPPKITGQKLLEIV